MSVKSQMKITLLIGIILIIGRIILGVTVQPESATFSDFYKDAAHLFVGGLAVAAWIQKHKWQWVLFWLLIIVEVAVAVLSRLY